MKPFLLYPEGPGVAHCQDKSHPSTHVKNGKIKACKHKIGFQGSFMMEVQRVHTKWDSQHEVVDFSYHLPPDTGIPPSCQDLRGKKKKKIVTCNRGGKALKHTFLSQNYLDHWFFRKKNAKDQLPYLHL